MALPQLWPYLSRMTQHGPLTNNPEWRITPGLTPYEEALGVMECHVDKMAAREAGERIWLVEHPPVITAGTSATEEDRLQPGRFLEVKVGRGGKLTYHGPGQRVIYPMLDIAARGRDVRCYVSGLEAWASAALSDLGIKAFSSTEGTGIWVKVGQGQSKIGAIGVRVRRWISFHGMALNVSTDLSHYDAIVPCGIAGHGVARITDFSPDATMADLDEALHRNLPLLLERMSGLCAKDS